MVCSYANAYTSFPCALMSAGMVGSGKDMCVCTCRERELNTTNTYCTIDKGKLQSPCRKGFVESARILQGIQEISISMHDQQGYYLFPSAVCVRREGVGGGEQQWTGFMKRIPAEICLCSHVSKQDPKSKQENAYYLFFLQRHAHLCCIEKKNIENVCKQIASSDHVMFFLSIQFF